MEFIIRSIVDHADFKACERLQADVLGFQDLDIVPYQLLQSFANSGGAVIGAFEGDQLIGMVMGYTGLLPDGSPYHRSQRMAVLPQYRSRGIGERLKRAQADLARRYNLDLMCWTYDPLRSTNAHLNIHKLGATSRRYIERAYAVSTSPRDEGAPIDRLWVEWPLATGRRGADGQDKRISHAQAEVLPVVLQDRDGLPSVPDLTSNACAVILQIPQDIDAERACGPERFVAWRIASRDTFKHYFECGYRVTDYVRHRGYILTQSA